VSHYYLDPAAGDLTILDYYVKLDDDAKRVMINHARMAALAFD
jgi:hypothetical protein